MRKLLSKLWADDDGFIISIEMLFIAVVLVIGLVAGWANLRAAIVTQFTTLANAILALNFDYEIDQIEGDTGASGGTLAVQVGGPYHIVIQGGAFNTANTLAFNAGGIPGMATTDIGPGLLDLVP